MTKNEMEFLDDGAVYGRGCEIYAFDETVIWFSAVPDAWGATEDLQHWVLVFPDEIWDGWDYCSGCKSVSPSDGKGAVDKERSRAFRKALAYMESGVGRNCENPTLVVTLEEEDVKTSVRIEQPGHSTDDSLD